MGEVSIDEASVLLPISIVLASLSSAALLDVEEVESSRYWMRFVPAISGASKDSTFDDEISATGNEICARRTGRPPRWLAARPT